MFFFYLLKKKQFKSDLYLSLNGIFIPNNNKGIIFFHNLLIFDDFELSRHTYSFLNIKAKILRYLFIKNYIKSHKAFFFSKSSRNLINKIIPLDIKKDYVVYHGINQNFFFQRKKRILSKNIKLIYPSSLLRYKNHFELIDALNQFDYKNYSIELNFIGQTFFYIKNILDKLIINNTNITINYLGNLDQKQQLFIFKNMDALIFPSSCETFGLSIYEGALAGLPIICSNKITCNEVLGSNVYYFDPFRKKSIINTLKYFIDNFEISHAYCSKNQNIIKKLKWSSQINKTIDLIKKK